MMRNPGPKFEDGRRFVAVDPAKLERDGLHLSYRPWAISAALLFALGSPSAGVASAIPASADPFPSFGFDGGGENIIGPLDPATGRVTEIYGTGTSSPAPGSGSSFAAGIGSPAQPGNAAASWSLSYTPAPAAAASASSAITGKADAAEKPNPALPYDGFGSYEGFADSKVFYSVQFYGPGKTVIIDINALLKTGGSGIGPQSEGLGSAGIEVYDAGDYAVFQDALGIEGDNQVHFLHVGNGLVSNTVVPFTTYSESGAYVFNTGQFYGVTVGAEADALTFGSPTGPFASAFAFGSIDPTFSIDPGMLDADEYGIVLSAGIGNSAMPAPAGVPEPPAVALFFGGLALGSLALRRARRPQRGAAPSSD